MKKNILFAICLIIIYAISVLSCGSSDDQINYMDTVDRILENLREINSDMALYSSTQCYKMVLSTDSGDKINYYYIQTEYYGEVQEIEGVHLNVIRAVIDPIAAESSRETKINDNEAIIYTYDGREYLCWTLSPEDSCIIEYTPGVLPEEDIIMMAESVG